MTSITPPTPKVILPVYDTRIPGWQAFVFATTSPMCAVLFTNPIDTAKVRLQLQNKMNVQIYKNSFDCITKILKNEGVRGIQQGLTPAIFREGSKNLFRIGFFDPLLNYLHDKKTEGPMIPMWKRIVASATSGALGAIACNPFELIKTRLQAQTRTGTAIGYQHNYNGMLGAFSDIIRKDGAAGLYKGSVLSVVRGICGTTSNLSTYSFLRDYFLTNKILPDSAWTDILCSTTSSLVTVMVMNPVDVIRTRVYNQPSPPPSSPSSSSLPSKDYYTGGMDAFVKIVRNEGVGALYKGFTTNFFRLAPHFTLTFLFLEQMRRASLNHTNKNFETEHKTKLGELYEVYNSKRFDENSLVEVLKSGMPNQDQESIEATVKEMNFSRDQTFEYNDFAEIVRKIEKSDY